ncbi:FAD-binding oxidoreductase [Pseudoduganella namucuonensis]|uniref:FAD/FMN-containing dehydrogenase n=1 Tax=Pseudoduganella namucuonensis TaxID=1035707 RepID=A0A1I7KTM5_9BURK|nr:FAD-binding oxidoreductase [Pseudoduganella namucuonensis]SFV00757.1 FAD/FMN-containing dehydrogenase [Pseudoduganella namucuonensis]
MSAQTAARRPAPAMAVAEARALPAADLLAQLAGILGAAGMLTASADCAPYAQGARYGQGQAAAVLRPATAEQAVAVLALLHANGAPFVPQGANTGLVAAATPDASGQQFVFSLDRLKGAIVIDAAERTATVGAGVRLSELNDAAAVHGLYFPIDLSADPSIGGMIASNTGGARLIKYGDVRANLCAVDAWLPGADGVIGFGSPLRKNNTGVDFKHLLCGTGGAFGVVLGATVRLHPLAAQRATALVVPASSEAVMPLLAALERELPEFIASVEGMSQAAMRAVFSNVPAVRNPFPDGEVPPYALLVELGTALPARRLALEAVLQDALGEMMEHGIVADALFGDEDMLWSLRHGISEALRHEGRVIAFDIALPRKEWAPFRAWGEEWLSASHPGVRICDFGHVADGGLHYNLVAPKSGPLALDDEAVAELRTTLLDAVVRRFQGSFSAEHGIGPYNQAYYQRYTPAPVRRLAGELQQLMMPALRCRNVRFD